MPQHHNHGMALLEVLLAMAIAALVLASVQRGLATYKAQREQTEHIARSVQLVSHLEGFVLATGRLPCPSAHGNGHEDRRADGICNTYQGWVPTASLGLPVQTLPWRFAVASLNDAGPPAAHSLVSQYPLALLSLPQLGEVIYAPPTSGSSVGQGPLPALHLCLAHGTTPLPPAQSRGCQALPTHSVSAVAVLIPPSDTVNQHRSHQFFINPNLPHHNPIWLSFERLSWLWLQRGGLISLTGSQQ
ncbi:type II secretion system protein [Limnobacter sp.]|uniref:type II secretion system protein n=1 Tax=Limnobacter sp. TaxID=2003368 RepID=UPI0035124C28